MKAENLAKLTEETKRETAVEFRFLISSFNDWEHMMRLD